MSASIGRSPLFEAAFLPTGPVLHLVGRVTDAVFSFLGPATAALARHGVPQTVVMVDDPLYRHLLPKFHESVRLVLTSASAPHGDRMKELLDAYVDAARARMPVVAHLHGLAGSLLGVYAAWFRGVTVPTCVTPHGSNWLKPWGRSFVMLLWHLRPKGRGLQQRAIANSRFDARTLSDFTQESVELIESPVADAFNDTRLVPSAMPCLVTGSRAPNPLGAALFAQCAVLMSDQTPGMRFEWLGHADTESAERLRAAGVTFCDLGNDADRAAQMATAWAFIAPAGGRGFPVFMAEAMALGLPCVAWDTPYHRDLICHGETGFLCRDSVQALEQLAALIESPELRARIGNAARAEARARFDGTRFSDSLLDAYAAQLCA